MRIKLFKNLPYKVLSLLFAVSFWFFLVIFQNIIYDVQEPISLEILNNPEGLEIANVLPDIQIRVTAPKDEVSFLRAEDFKAYIDLKDVEEGEQEASVTVTTSRPNVKIVAYIPQTIKVALEEVQAKSFAIRAEVMGGPDPDYMIGEPSYTPRKATVHGPRSLIERISYVGHKVILNKSHTESIENTHILMAYDEAGSPIEHGLNISPKTVDTKLELIKTIDEKSIPVRMTYVKEIDTGLIKESSVDPSVVIIRGPIGLLEELQYIDTLPITRKQLEEAITGKERTVDLNIPEGLEVVDGDAKVELTIR